MEGDNHDEQTKKTCRFSGEPCIKEACEQWVEIGVTKAGSSIALKQGMCVFTALVLIGNTPKVVMAPPQRMPNLGLRL